MSPGLHVEIAFFPVLGVAVMFPVQVRRVFGAFLMGVLIIAILPR